MKWKIVHIRGVVPCKECDNLVGYQYHDEEGETTNICHTCVDTNIFIEAMKNMEGWRVY